MGLFCVFPSLFFLAPCTVHGLHSQEFIRSFSSCRFSMTSHASSSGIESDTDSSPSVTIAHPHNHPSWLTFRPSLQDNNEPSITDTNHANDESLDTIHADDVDEGVDNTDFEQTDANLTLAHAPSSEKHTIIAALKSICRDPCHYPYSTRNPYEDEGMYGRVRAEILREKSPLLETLPPSAAEDWDEECRLVEPYCT